MKHNEMALKVSEINMTEKMKMINTIYQSERKVTWRKETSGEGRRGGASPSAVTAALQSILQ